MAQPTRELVLFNNSEGPFSGGVCYQRSISCAHYGPVRGVHGLSQVRLNGAGAKQSASGEPSLSGTAFLNN